MRMRWLIIAVCFLLLVLSAGPLSAVTRYELTIMLSNEGSGFLIDRLIAAGHQNENLYTVLQFLQPYSGDAIPQSFMDALAVTPPGSDIFTVGLFNFSSGANNPIGISMDGSLIIAPVYGYDYSGRSGYTTYSSVIQGLGTIRFTIANDPAHYIDVGSDTNGGYTTYYHATAIIWGGPNHLLHLPLIIRP
jgi:hypothetical protein